ncbi:DNA cytosine methyltransferase [Allopusillimonas ginsengisoli]|uniref:DNA cytosine methyltransferase n=1 Tax=Allopusillimonas ginsengisoli TaxID=453575 RepID=UPI0039C006E6
MNELALFAGAGGGILGGHLLGWRTICAVEYDAYARSVLLARQNDGTFPPFPVWDDIRTFDGLPWRGIVDVVSGGFPCQDISVAGNGAGIDGERSGLWSQMERIIHEVQPRFVFVENSPILTVRGLGRVLGDLAIMGFNAKWGVLGAHNAGAPHLRDRIWIVAHAMRVGFGQQEGVNSSASNQERNDKTHREVRGSQPDSAQPGRKALRGPRGYGWSAEPKLDRMADGVANRPYRIKAIGNGQVPRVAATAFNILSR